MENVGNQLMEVILINPCPAEPRYAAFANSIDSDQLASTKANWSGSALFVINYVNLYQQSESSNLIGWKLEIGETSWFIQHDKG